MAASLAQTFVVIFPNYWGKAKTIADAVREARKAGYYRRDRKKAPAHVLAIACEPDKVAVTSFVDVTVEYPKEVAAVKWEMNL